MTSRIISKFTIYPVWLWERKRKYSIRYKWSKLSPIRCNIIDNKQLVVLTTPNNLDDSVWSIWSWMQYLKNNITPNIIVDGDIPTDWIERVEKVVPNIKVSTVSKVLQNMMPEGKYSALDSFKTEHPLGRKFLLILALQNEFDLIYSDSDVLVFGEPSDLIDCFLKGIPCFNQEHAKSAYDLEMVKAGKKMNLVPSEKLNSGLMFIPRNSLCFNLADKLISKWYKQNLNWFSEQTAFAILMNNIGATPLPVDKYVVNNSRQFWINSDVDYTQIHTRHFTGTVRHIMYKNGLPQLLRISNL